MNSITFGDDMALRLQGIQALAGIGLASTLMLGGCAAFETRDDETVDRLDRIESRLEQVERLVESDSLVDLAAQLDEVQSEIRGLRGEIETLQYELGGVRERQREIYLDVDRRLRRLEVGGPGGDVVPDVSLEDDPMPRRVDGEPREAYDEAFGLLREGRYDAAGEAFEAFLDRHHDSELSANARYWLGEVHYVTRDFEQAAAEFQRVLDDHPGSGKVADARLKLGFAYYELQRWDEARAELEAVRSEHPDSSAARLANNRLNRMADEGR
ncbi:tol-pal system protein YbgF [Natronospira bacteriovora]|uniref:Cell division coordinator CpoB n=1 Tax=Natronospira bacteriovora TaxID=3069753 RepID=A0ABU0W683_9GAMM|nr:tol-pal system protein YbgF [Natronospira sp. AB-CW4]MDQ2068505.1 tol-pal system protein YbgF [Natronospira sp. AB-CW4]